RTLSCPRMAWSDERADLGGMQGGRGLDLRLRTSGGGGRRQRAGPRAGRGGARRMKTLVIDDEAPIRLLCRVNLEAEGIEVIEAPDGATGVELAKQEQPDAILLDVMMPGLDGWSVAERLLTDEATGAIPIIFLTARADLRDRVRGLDVGGLDYVTKPFNPVDLAPLVRGVVDAVERGEREQIRTERSAARRALV